MHKKIGILFGLAIFFSSNLSFATAYQVPYKDEALIGRIRYEIASGKDTTASLTERYDIGHDALLRANPHLSLQKNLPQGAPLQIPTAHLLPNEMRKGIVINLPEMRMYYFPAGTNQVLTYPVGIGKVGKTIPIQNTIITRKKIDPSWTPPEDIREFNLEQGIVLPKVMGPGPDNPLGPYAIYMRIPTYLIHSTIFPDSVGKRASFGCIRMFESDIKEFFPLMQKGIPVAIINKPVKVGWNNNRLFMEVHPVLQEHSGDYQANLLGMVDSAEKASKDSKVLIDWQGILFIARERDGVPHDVGVLLG